MRCITLVSSPHHKKKQSGDETSITWGVTTGIRAPSCPQYIQSEVCIVTVGLPARGKTYLAMKLARYFRWIGINTEGKLIYSVYIW